MVLFIYFVPGVVTHYRQGETKLDAQQVDDALRNLVIPGIGGAPGGLGGLPPLEIPAPPRIQ